MGASAQTLAKTKTSQCKSGKFLQQKWWIENIETIKGHIFTFEIRSFNFGISC